MWFIINKALLTIVIVKFIDIVTISDIDIKHESITVSKWSLGFNTLTIFTYSLLLGVVYQVLLNCWDMEKQGEVAITQLDTEITSVLNELSFVEIPVACSEEYRHRLARSLYSSLNIRTVVIGEPYREGTTFCGSMGEYIVDFDSRFARSPQIGDVFLAQNTRAEYRNEASIVVGKWNQEKVLLAFINPRFILGRWLEPFDGSASISLEWLNSDESILTRYNQGSYGGSEWLNQRYIERQYLSDLYPYQVTVMLSYSVIWTHIVEFILRLIIGLAALSLVAAIGAVSVFQFSRGKFNQH